jgi:hypothetical protein
VGGRIRGPQSTVSPREKRKSLTKNWTKAERDGSVDQVVEHLTSNSNYSAAKNNNKLKFPEKSANLKVVNWDYPAQGKKSEEN